MQLGSNRVGSKRIGGGQLGNANDRLSSFHVSHRYPGAGWGCVPLFQPIYASEPTLPAVGARGGTMRMPQSGGKLSSLGAPLRSVSHEMNGSGCRGAPAAASPFDLIEPRFRSMRQARSAAPRVPAGATRRAGRIASVAAFAGSHGGPRRGCLFGASGEGRGGRGQVYGSGPGLAKPTARSMTPPRHPFRSARRERLLTPQ